MRWWNSRRDSQDLTAAANRPHLIGRNMGWICLLCWAFAAASVHGTQSNADWLRADAATVRLRPGSLARLPASIRIEMERRGCTVPQPFGSNRPRNVISGHFKEARRTDWAALCSRGGRSVVLVFHGTNFSAVDELDEAADSDYLQTVSEGRIGFSRALAVVSPSIMKGTPDANDLKPRVIDHDGIDDAFEGKGSTILYWTGKKWIRLQGAD
jgi:hypothetical protein